MARWTDVEKEVVRAAYPTADVERIAKVLGRSAYSVAYMATTLGVCRRTRRKWTAGEEERLIELRRSGMTYAEAAGELDRTVMACKVRMSAINKRKLETNEH